MAGGRPGSGMAEMPKMQSMKTVDGKKNSSAMKVIKEKTYVGNNQMQQNSFFSLDN